MRRKRGLTRAELDYVLWNVFPDSVQCYAHRFASHRWSACTAMRDGEEIVAWVSEEDYATHFEALCAAYRRARALVGLTDERGYSEN